MKAVVAAFNQEKALVGAFSVLTNLWMELFQALVTTPLSTSADLLNLGPAHCSKAASIKLKSINYKLLVNGLHLCPYKREDKELHNAQLATMSRGRYQARRHLMQSFWHLSHRLAPPSNIVKGTRVIAHA